MNSFRIAILSILIAAVGIMGVVVYMTIPSMKDRKTEYDNSRADRERRERQEAEATEEVAPKPAEDSALARARAEHREAAERREQEVNNTEEQLALESGLRKEREARSRQAAEEAAAPTALGLVQSYDTNWNIITVKSVTDKLPDKGTLLAVRREGLIVCEATVTNVEPEVDAFTAEMRYTDQNNNGEDLNTNNTPVPGDQVILFPGASDSGLSLPGNSTSGGSTEDALPTIDATLVPVP